MDPENFNPNFAYIEDGGHIFQVLNADGTDWDPEATAAVYYAWLDAGGNDARNVS